MINKKSKKRNFEKSFRRISKLKKYIGGENCDQYKDQYNCVLHKPDCLWKATQNKCIDNKSFKNETTQAAEIHKPTQNYAKEQETKQVQTKIIQEVQTLPISNTKTSSIVFGKRQPSSASASIPSTILKKPQSVQLLEPTKVKIFQTLSQKRNILDNLPLVEPFIAADENWPILTDVINVPGDGDCLFHALRAGLRSLGLYQGSSRELRALIVAELRKLLKNGDDLSPFFYTDALGRQSKEHNLTFGDYFESQYATDTKKIPLSKQVKTYLDKMASYKFGTEIEIWMAAMIFNVNIDVFTLPRDPLTNKPLETGKIMLEGKSQYLPLQQLNITENTSLPTIRLFNASGASADGMHYEVLPSSISIDQYLSQNK